VILAPAGHSKGQVERTVGYLETSFLPLRTFTSIEDLQAQHDTWTKEIAYRRSPDAWEPAWPMPIWWRRVPVAAPGPASPD